MSEAGGGGGGGGREAFKLPLSIVCLSDRLL